jgi:hypothetical protein
VPDIPWLPQSAILAEVNPNLATEYSCTLTNEQTKKAAERI